MAESNQRCSCTYPNYNPFTDRCMICGGYYCKDLLTNPPPMTNDKLTEVIKNEINAEADKYSEIILNNRLLHVDDKLKGYIAGATAWAPWKISYDEVKSSERAISKRYAQALIDRDEMKAQAQRMADALEDAKYYVRRSLSNDDEQHVKEAQQDLDKIDAVLQQFKDGTKGKEVGKIEPTISKCGMCHKEGVNQYLGNQFYLCDECFENYENSRDQP